MTPETGSGRPRAAIFGCLGTVLDPDERRFFRDCDPLGFILFARNCDTPEQVHALVSDLRESVGRDNAPVLIDQEGGRVQRLKPPRWSAYPSARKLVNGVRHARPQHLAEAIYLNARLIAHDLSVLGIDVNCTPVLDVPGAGSHEIVGDRAYGDDPSEVAKMGKFVCDGMLAGGVLPVIKHIPGHGRARVDSHEELPVVVASRADLERVDFAPFRQLAHMPWGMTCHLMYPELDPEYPATHSSTIIGEIIRTYIGFDGVLCTDDLSMKALGGGVRQRAERALVAGCDLVLHCNADSREMHAVAEGVEVLTDKAMHRLQRGETIRRDSLDTVDFDVDAARARFNEIMDGS